jgi:hypothetical protein
MRLTVRDFADDLGANPRTITRWESLKNGTPGPELQRALDTVLDRATDGDRSRFLTATEHDEPGPPGNGRVAPLVVGAPDDGPGPPGQVRGSRWKTGVQLMDGPPTLAELTEEDMAMAESAWFIRRSGALASADVVEQLRSDVSWLAKEYLRRPPYAMFRLVSGLRRDVFAMVDARPHPRYLPDLYSVAGWLSALLAHAGGDIGQRPAAQTHSRSAWLCADHADDDELRCYVSWLRSNDAYWAEEYVSAAGLAQSGRQYARYEGDMLRLISQEARARAAAGDASAAKAVLAQTLRLRDRVATAPQTRGVLGFAVGKVAYYSSEVRLALGDSENARLAAADAEEGLELLSADGDSKHSVELRAAARLDLVMARLRLDDLDGAVHHLGQALGVPAESRTVPVLGRIRAVDAAFGSDRFTNADGVPEAREELPSSPRTARLLTCLRLLMEFWGDGVAVGVPLSGGGLRPSGRDRSRCHPGSRGRAAAGRVRCRRPVRWRFGGDGRRRGGGQVGGWSGDRNSAGA